jgi:hypothetical protein
MNDPARTDVLLTPTMLGRSAAPDSRSNDATILVLGRKAMKRLSEERTGLSVQWKEAGWRSLTRLEPQGKRCRMPESPGCAIDIARSLICGRGW